MKVFLGGTFKTPIAKGLILAVFGVDSRRSMFKKK